MCISVQAVTEQQLNIIGIYTYVKNVIATYTKKETGKERPVSGKEYMKHHFRMECACMGL